MALLRGEHVGALLEITAIIAATLHATLTPDLGHGFPDALYVTYFVTHGGVVLAAPLLVVGCGIALRAGAAARAFASTLERRREREREDGP